MKVKPNAKKRLYAPDEDCLAIIKAELKKEGLKSNNSQAVNVAVFFLAKTIKTKEAGERAYKKEQKSNKNKSKQKLIKSK
jgi:hypothetical protein|tara:strand:- start:14289 stop:14528 length:240 start_codon:yes stop_codon:yes gene_type:complete